MLNRLVKRFYRQPVVLALFAFCIGSVLWFVDLTTASRISYNEQEKLQSTLAEVLSNHPYDNNLALTKNTLYDEVIQQTRTIYTASLNGIHSATIISAMAADGYAGQIELLVGISAKGNIVGVRVIQHQETPGLGDDIELRRSNWILSFNGKNINTPIVWAVKRDGGTFDQFTGATITPRAVVNAVRKTLIFYDAHQHEIFSRL